jgi:hypothetical protein
MTTDFVTLLKRSRLMQLGIAAIVIGIGFLGYAGLNTPPARDTLTKVSGVLAEGKQSTTTRKKRGQSTGTVVSTSYELGLRQPNGEIRKFNVDGTWVTRTTLEAAMQRPLVAEVDSENFAMAMTSNGQIILSYENSAKTYDIDNKKNRDIGAPLTAVGFPLLLLGWFLSRRSVLKQMATSSQASVA